MDSIARRILLCTVLLALLVTVSPGCGRENQDARRNKGKELFSLADKAAGPAELRMETAADLQPSAPEKRKVIVSHNLTIEVKDLNAAFHALNTLAEQYGGYTMESSRSRQGDGSLTGSISMRIHPGRAGGLLEKLRAMGRVTNEHSSGEDITEEYVDVEARLANMRASEARLQDLLLRKTRKLSDVLAVEKELTWVRGEIESFEARKRIWDVLTALETIHIELREPAGMFPSLHRIWNPIRTGVAEAAVSFAESLHSLIIFLGQILPWIAGLGAVVCGIARLRQKRRIPNQA